jgi:nucleotidyltransferase substrate binding protein (TIGR01987 family)
LDALKTLEDGVAFFHESEENFETNPTKQNERIFLSARDSIIQRFEYCIDLFWKTLKVFLDNEKVILSMVASREIIRACVAARFLSENEGDQCMKMVGARNKTSHIYHETMAEAIARQVPDFYELMQEIAERMQKRWDK